MSITPFPRSEGELAKFVMTYARRHALDVGRVRNWVSFLMVAGMLSEHRHSDGRPRFVVKGGVALEIRLPGTARATRDLDLIADVEGDLVRQLESALSGERHGFRFRRKGGAIQMPNGAVRSEFQVSFRGKAWGTVPIDIATGEGDITEVDELPAPPLSELGLPDPAEVPCLSLRHHIAQKLHAVTRQDALDHPNDRFRDVIDIFLLKPLFGDTPALCEACKQIFAHRKTHAWPPRFAPPSRWSAPLAALAADLQMEIPNLAQVTLAIQEYIDAINAV